MGKRKIDKTQQASRLDSGRPESWTTMSKKAEKGSQAKVRRRQTNKGPYTLDESYPRRSLRRRRFWRDAIRCARKKWVRPVAPAMLCNIRKTTTPCQCLREGHERDTLRIWRRTLRRARAANMSYQDGTSIDAVVASSPHRRKRISFDVPLRVGTHSGAHAISDEDPSS